MTDIHETAYPRIRSEITEEELTEIYTPSKKEIAFVNKHARQSAARQFLLYQLKLVQRMGYFMPIADVPKVILDHMSTCINARRIPRKTLTQYPRTGAYQRHLKLIRTYLNLKEFDSAAKKLMREACDEAATTKDILADIINAALETLIKARVVLPAYSTMLRVAQASRNAVNEYCYRTIAENLNHESKSQINDLFPADSLSTGSWYSLKREIKKPTNIEIRSFVQHLEWQKSIVSSMPDIKQLPIAKLNQYKLEALSYDVATMRELKPAKRYTLAVVLIHTQYAKSLDTIADVLIKKLRSMHSKGKRKLVKYKIEYAKRVDSLVLCLRDMVAAYQVDAPAIRRIKAIGYAMKEEPNDILDQCDEYIASMGDNYFPFLKPTYQPARRFLLNCLGILELESASNDQSLIRAIDFVLKNNRGHKKLIPNMAANGKPLNLSWMPEKWRKLVFVKDSEDDKCILLHRHYFELAVLSQVTQELKSADLFVKDGHKYDDIRQKLISEDTFANEIDTFGEMMGYAIEPGKFVNQLKSKFIALTNKTDQSFPNNKHVEITSSGLVISKLEAEESPEGWEIIDKLLTERLEDVNIIDALVNTEKWLNLSRYFKPISGFDAKIDHPTRRFITTLFCFGCNLGPTQTAKSITGLSRKQVAWLNLRHVTEERLEKAIEQVINAYNKYTLPKYWGTGKSASVDGTQWSVYEQNLLSEYHIRYGEYGGIGYYHVSDKYIALFCHFISCGVYEALYLLDGLLKNESDIQPDTVHGDTHSQSTTVYGLAHLLGIKLMPRIKNIKDLIFYRPEKGVKYKNINALFGESINWELIETHLPDMLRVAMSVKHGVMAASDILRRFGTYSRKNRMYFAFRELGRVMRTMFLLEYISDKDMRRTVNAATNKSEAYNQFIHWSFFGDRGVIKENRQFNQRKIIKYNQLVGNLLILYNVNAMTKTLRQLKKDGYYIDEKILSKLAPYRTHHINRLGKYPLDLSKKVAPMELGGVIL